MFANYEKKKSFIFFYYFLTTTKCFQIIFYILKQSGNSEYLLLFENVIRNCFERQFPVKRGHILGMIKN